MFLILVSFTFCYCANINFYYTKNGKIIKWRANTKIPDIQYFTDQNDSLNSELEKEFTEKSWEKQNKITNHKDSKIFEIKKKDTVKDYKKYKKFLKSQFTTSECYYPDINKRYFSPDMVDEFHLYGFMDPNDLHKFDTKIFDSESELEKLLKN